MKRNELCVSCIWVIKVNEGVSVCPFVRCQKEDGWIADKKEKVNKE